MKRMWFEMFVLAAVAGVAGAGFTQEVVFADSFDRGDPCSWSTTNPSSGCTAGITINLPGDVTMELVYIPAGTFQMGSPTAERGQWLYNEDLHEVTLTQGYYLGKYEVTQAQWQAVMGSMPDDCGNTGVGPNYPVYCVSWDEICGGTSGDDCLATSFIGKLNQQQGTTAFRLPTEAEWERGERAGTQTAFSFGDDLSCNLIDCSPCFLFDRYMLWCGNQVTGVEEIGSTLPNAFGLYGMHGNVTEWVADRYDEHLGFDPQIDPTGSISGLARVVRGGSFAAFARECRSALRVPGVPSVAGNGSGFRVARSE